MNKDAETAAYYEEEVTITMQRLTLMCIIGACILALKHPDAPDDVTHIIKTAIRGLTPLVDYYVPDDVLEEWDRELDIS